MSIFNCVSKLVKAGRISESQGQKIAAKAERIKNRLLEDAAEIDPDIDSKASDLALKELLHEISMKKLSEAKSIVAFQRARQIMETSPEGAKLSLLEMLGHVTGRQRSGLPSMEDLADALSGHMQRRWWDIADELRSKVPGRFDANTQAKQRAGRQLVRAIFEEDAEAFYKKAAKDITEDTRKILDEFRAHGIDIGEARHYITSMRIRPEKMRGMSVSDYVDFMVDKIDRKTARNFETGRKLTTQEIREILAQQYQTIRTGGASKALDELSPQFTQGKSTKGRLESARLFDFKDSDSFMKWWERFGEGNLFDAMEAHQRKLAMDLAAVKLFGPNPDLTVKKLNQIAKALDEQGAPKRKGVSGAIQKTLDLKDPEVTYNYLRGKFAYNPSRAAAVISDLITAARNFATATFLPKAALLTVSDQSYMRTQMKLIGGSYSRAFKFMLDGLNGLDREARDAVSKHATIFGFGVEWTAGHGIAASRWADVNVTGRMSHVTARMADFTTRATGLQAMTVRAQMATHLEVEHVLYHAAKNFDEVSDDLKIILKQFNIDNADWNAIQKSKIVHTDKSGKEFFGIDLDKLTAESITSRDKMLGMIKAIVREAVPEPGVIIRSSIQGGEGPGSMGALFRKGLFQFKNFPLSVTLNTLGRLVFGQQPATTKAMLFVQQSIYAAMLGMAAEQMRQFASGKKPKEVDHKLFLKGWINSGGLLILESLLNTPKDKRELTNMIAKLTPSMAIAISAFSLLQSTTKLGTELGSMGLEELGVKSKDSTDFKREKRIRKHAYDIVGELEKMHPDTWYTMLILERYVFDQLQRISDPKRFQRKIKRRKKYMKEANEEFYLEPGKLLGDN